MKIITVLGARPQFIKAAIVSKKIVEKAYEIKINTGQHYDYNMSGSFIDDLGYISPKYNLSVGSGTHGEQTAKMLLGIEPILILEKPNYVIVYGDTNSTLAGALAASKLNIPVIHIEAGLRSYNSKMPEERNRVLTDHMSEILFCPSKVAHDNLLKEGISKNVYIVGDIMYDSILNNINISKKYYDDTSWMVEHNLMSVFNANTIHNNFYLATIHRAENTDNINSIRIILDALNKLEKSVIFPVHPRTRKMIKDLSVEYPNIHLIEPINYHLMLHLIENAYMVVTDSGGVQKEAYLLKTPCTTIREQTEWVETLEYGWNILSSLDSSEIVQKSMRFFDKKNTPHPEYYGNGDAVNKIVEIISEREKNE